MAKTTVSDDPTDVAAPMGVDEPGHTDGGDSAPTVRNGRGRRGLTRELIAVAVGVCVLIVICSLVLSGNEASTTAGSSEHLVAEIPAPRGPKTPVESLAAPVLAPQRPQATPTAAVSAYLSAEINLDFDASFALLDEADRAKVGDVTAWAAQQPDRPTYRTFSVLSTSATGVVTTTVDLVPRLDEAIGFVPATAQVGWVTTASAAGYTVAASKAAVTPILPADAGSVTTAISWANDIANGVAPGDVQYDGSLLGQPELVEQLATLGAGSGSSAGSGNAAGSGSSAGSGSTAVFSSVGSPISIEDWPAATTVTNAFGAGAFDWARVVSLQGPKNLDVVLAPLGDRWQVVGVIAT